MGHISIFLHCDNNSAGAKVLYVSVIEASAGMYKEYKDYKNSSTGKVNCMDIQMSRFLCVSYCRSINTGKEVLCVTFGFGVFLFWFMSKTPKRETAAATSEERLALLHFVWLAVSHSGAFDQH